MPLNWEDVTCLRVYPAEFEGHYEVRVCHTAAAVSARFDEPNLVSCAGLVPVLRLAERAGCMRLPSRGSASGLCRECRGECKPDIR
jgi:hypothetical protein